MKLEVDPRSVIKEMQLRCRGIYEALDRYIAMTNFTLADEEKLVLIGQIRVEAYRLSGDKPRSYCEVENEPKY